MKTYKVLEAHLGDKFYKPGDPETGTRVADPNAVGHLVTLLLLEEIGDAPDVVVSADAATAANDAAAQIEALTGERDDARAELAQVRDLHSSVDGDLVAACRQIGQLTVERNDAKALLDASRDDLAAARQQIEDVNVSIATARADLDAANQRVEALTQELEKAKAPQAESSRHGRGRTVG